MVTDVGVLKFYVMIQFCPLAGLKSFPTEGIIKKIVDHINLLVDLMMMKPEI